ncbi:MAG: glycosyltransferase, partial [Candidatus Marinimicrobia bacterium]|nr:glycosyltransferase [Candidatus Neomarinimicrobiota bacterium]
MFPLFLTIALLYALFILWLWRGVLRLEPLVPSTSRPFVSVIVAARNEAQNLPGLLDSLRIQSYPADRLELIVVDDGSTDDTYSILSQHTTRMTNLVPLQVTEVPAGWSPRKWALTPASKA